MERAFKSQLGIGDRSPILQWDGASRCRACRLRLPGLHRPVLPYSLIFRVCRDSNQCQAARPVRGTGRIKTRSPTSLQKSHTQAIQSLVNLSEAHRALFEALTSRDRIERRRVIQAFEDAVLRGMKPDHRAWSILSAAIRTDWGKQETASLLALDSRLGDARAAPISRAISANDSATVARLINSLDLPLFGGELVGDVPGKQGETLRGLLGR